MVIELTERKERQKIRIINFETITRVYNECQGDWQDLKECRVDDRTQGRRFNRTSSVCMQYTAFDFFVPFFFYTQEVK